MFGQGFELVLQQQTVFEPASALRPPALAHPSLLSLARPESEGAVLGISKVWVLPTHRRTGVATRMLESARRHTVYGPIVPAHQVAFTSPTPSGRELAVNYTQREGGLRTSKGDGLRMSRGCWCLDRLMSFVAFRFSSLPRRLGSVRACAIVACISLLL